MKNLKKVSIKTAEEFYNRPFPSLLRELRKQYKLSQQEIADKLGISRQSISNYELGVTFPDIYSAEAIIEFFNKNYGLDYNILYWMGKEEVSKGVAKREIPLSNTSIELIKAYEKDYRLITTLEILLKEKKFLKNLSQYIVDDNIIRNVLEKEYPKEFKEIEGLLPRFGGAKFRLYDVQEELPLLKKYASKELEEELKDRVDVSQYVREVITNTMLEEQNLKVYLEMLALHYKKEVDKELKRTKKSKSTIIKKKIEIKESFEIYKILEKYLEK